MEVLIIFFIIYLYFLPASIAFNKKHKSKGEIFFLNIILGWTVLFWFICFFWSLSGSEKVIVKEVKKVEKNCNSYLEELEALAKLKDSGVLTEEEFNVKKSIILARENHINHDNSFLNKGIYKK